MPAYYISVHGRKIEHDPTAVIADAARVAWGFGAICLTIEEHHKPGHPLWILLFMTIER